MNLVDVGVHVFGIFMQDYYIYKHAYSVSDHINLGLFFLCIQEFADLPNNCLQTDMAFSPDEQIILTGTSTKGLHDEEGRGKPAYFISCFLLLLLKRLSWHVICFPFQFLNTEDILTLTIQ